MHNYALQNLGIDGFYGRIRLESGASIKKVFFDTSLKGANITVPFKEEAFKIADILGGREQKIGAINTLVRKGDLLHGFNTDIDGIIQSIRPFGKIKNALILGAGGTAKAAYVAFNELGIQSTILNRSRTRLESFQSEGAECYDFATFSPKNFDLIFNTTSAGLGDDSYPCPREMLQELFVHKPYVMDAIYGKDTPFLALAKESKLVAKDGEDMLLWQGAYAFCKFFDDVYSPSDIYLILKAGISL